MKNETENLPPCPSQTALEKRRADLASLIKRKRISLTKLPGGNLRINCKSSGPQYYRVEKRADDTPSKTAGSYLPKDDMTLIAGLAQRRYNEKVLKLAEKEAAQIDAFFEHWHPDRIDALYSMLPPARQTLVTPVTLSDADYAAAWLSEPYPERNGYALKGEFTTKNGVSVRSKSELLIAGLLDEYGVPFHYEWPLRFRGRKNNIFPDFTCLNLKTRKVMYWEHFGMMDSETYAASAVEKQRLYVMNGLFPGIDMIYTMETAEKPLDMQVVRCLIERLLL